MENSNKDPRCLYIAQTAASMFGNSQMASALISAPEVHQFLNELTVKVLQIMSDGKKFRCFTNSVANPPPQALEVHFVKIAAGAEEITQDRIQFQVMVSTIRGGSVAALHAYLNTIYAPVLFGEGNDAAAGVKQDNQLRDLLYSLKAGLHRTIKKGGSSLQSVDFNEEEFKGILSLNDEIECWQEIERENIGSAQNEKLRRKAEIISKHFNKISAQVQELHQLDLGTVTTLVDAIQDAFDQIWRDPNVFPPYPQGRMENLFRVTTKMIGGRIEREFKENDIWQASYSDVRVKLNECMRICRGWKDRMTELTREFWKVQGEKHQWQGKPFNEPYLDNIIVRISAIFELRSQHDELLWLLTPEQRERLNVTQAFDSFRKINTFYTNEYQVIAWQRANKEYEEKMEGIEKEICTKLRGQFNSDGKATPSQQLREFQRWKGLLSKDSIKKEMQTERETLLTQLIAEVDQKYKVDFENRTGQSLEQLPDLEKPPQSQNVSDTISGIIWARQLSLKIQSNLKVAVSLFQDLPAHIKLQSSSQDLCNSIQAFEQSLFKKWLDKINKALSNPQEKLKYEMSGQLMDFDYEAGGLLKVNYSEKLVTLVKDARVLGEHGFKISKEIHDVTEKAKKFYKEGVTLKQVANFYNSMGTQMIDCQKPMMLEKAAEFESLIKNPQGNKGGRTQGTVTWSDPIEIENYTKKVQAKATELIAENRRLRKVHMNVTDMIIELMNIDLLKNRTLWKDNLGKIRKVVDQTIAKLAPELYRLWLRHLNFQLYKALEIQYQLGLDTLNESLPEIQADMVYRNNTLEFRPTFEELKQRYYKEISIFITIPLKFNGVSDRGDSSIYKLMPDQNAAHLGTVYFKAEELFTKLQGLTREYLPWACLGNVDLNAFIEQNFTSVQDWDDNFQMLRQKRKELKKLPDSTRVDCIAVNLLPFKNGIEDLYRRLSDALVDSLQESIEKDNDVVFQFIRKGLDKLSTNPSSVEEIEKMHSDALEIAAEKEGIVGIFSGCQEKSKMIKQITGKAMLNNQIESMWREFDARLAAFNDKIEDQKARLVQELDGKIKTLNSDLEKMFDKWQAKKPKDNSAITFEEAVETSEIMKDLRNNWTQLQDRIAKINRDCKHFGQKEPKFTFYDKMKDELDEQDKAWSLFDEFKSELDKFSQESWLTFRKKEYFKFQDFFLSQAEKLKSMNKNVVSRFLLRLVDDYQKTWPLIKLCTGESFEKEHWRKLITMLKMPKEVTFDNLTFGNLLDSVPEMLKKHKEIKELSDKAQGEVTIREAINELRVWCETTEFVLSEYESNGRNTPLIKEWKEVITQVSDHQSLIMSLKESRYFSSFSDQIEQLEKKFGGVDDYLSKLNIIQRKWVYLEPIFMKGALPSEQGRFRRVDEEYRSIALGIGSDPKVMSLCEIQGLKDTLDTILTQLEMCQKALNDFLEDKRQKFSRFYFIGDDDLLEILGQAQNPTVIQSHLKKLFSGIHKVEFNKDNKSIKSMISSQGEYVTLVQPVQINAEVEDWLGQLEKVMRLTLDSLLKQTLSNEKGLEIVNTPSQICCLAEMIQFSNNAVNAIKKGKLQNYKSDLQSQLQSYTTFNHNGDNLLLLKVKALIIDILHNIEVMDQLISDGINSSMNPNDWMWFKQLRYKIEAKNNQCMVGMCDAFFDYTYEYQGNASKLTHTPLTDKCYLTLVLGMKLGYGGNPYGPAGTGKTESVKALGQAFGRQVLVFNCDEGIDFKSMGRIFIGLVKCGAWGCFDEFNRLLEEQLSAISQQIQVIQWAIKENQPSLQLLGRTIAVNKNAGIFVTMNPAGKGYGGRSKLPDNLKQLFRPVAMSAPDILLIAESMMLAEGFKEAKQLSTKIVSLFLLCSQLLSKQQHYDWKLRAQKPILVTAGRLLQQELKKGRVLKYEDEALILIKSIRVNTMSKLTYQDAVKYEGLQKDMFPNIKSEDIAYEQLTAAVRQTISDMKLQEIEKQIMKIQQFYEATKQRMGVIIVGPSGCGKTTIWKILKSAYEKMNVNIVTHVMNPKSMPREQLLGHMNHDTREFNDGVLTLSSRNVVKESNDTICWIVCDGDVDPEWIESLNSVMDDNHLLTLPNGERIQFGDNVNFIFETNDMRFASPATVSRLGMIFLSEEDVNVQRITQTWIKKQPEGMQLKLNQWMEDIFYQSLDWVLQRQEKMIVETTKVGVVNNALAYLQKCESKGQFAYAVICGLGSNFTYQLRAELASLVMSVASERAPNPDPLMNFFDPKTQAWSSFSLENKEIKIEELKDPDSPPLIQTCSIQRDIALVRPLLENDESFILVGPEGCGKNLVITSLIKQMKSTQVAIIHCNAQTAAFHVIQKLNQMCAQSTNSQGRVYRPKECQRLIIYLKDINLPKPDKYDTIQLISFLQQIVCYKGFYDKNLDFVSLERIIIVASMNPSSTIGRHQISTRFTANVRVVYMDYAVAEELLPVYNSFMKTILSHSRFGNGSMAGSSKRLSSFLIDLYSNVRSKFSVDEHRHYIFTPRNITYLIFSILRYEIPEAQSLIEILIYESSRIYRDRLVDGESGMRFDNVLYTLLKNHLKYPNRLMDTFFLSKIVQGTPSLLKGLPSMGKIMRKDYTQMIETAMRSYEREFKELDIHLIDEVLDLIAFQERVLSKPGGCLLLAGRSGVGRKQTCLLVTHLLNMTFFSPNINREYNMKEFKRDLKTVLQKTGIEAEKTCLFIEDHQILTSEFLELLNSLISAGEIPGLYSPEELEPLLAQLQEEMRNQYECRTLFEFFVSRVKQYLSIVISLDNTHPNFQRYCAQNPALFNKCVVVWNDGWSKQSLQAVAQAELKEAESLIDKQQEQIIKGAVDLHTWAREALSQSPQKFVNFMHAFKHILQQIITNSGGQTKHLIAGLEKLQQASQTVDKLSSEATKKQQLLSVKQKEATQAMGKIQVSMEQKAERKQEVEALQARCNEDEKIIVQRKQTVEHELSGIQPEVDQARAAVGELKSSNLNEIKNFRVPPDAVVHVLGAVMLFMGSDDTSWNGMKRFLSNTGVIGQIINFDARQVSPQLRTKVNKLIAATPASFEDSVIRNASQAAGPLAAWVKANVKYSEVLLKIEPLTSELDGLMKKLNISQQRVNECNIQLQELSEATDKLNKDFQDKTMEAARLEADLRQAQETLTAASSLLKQLQGENERWKQQVKQLEKEMSLVPSKALISSAYLVYLGGQNETFREETLKQWLTTIKVESYSFKNFLSSEAQMLTWKKEKLPADSLSMENAIMILNSLKTPLIIDPATQATEWLKRSLKAANDNVEVLNHQDPKYNTQIELSIRFGKILIIQEVDGIESMLVPILRKDLIQQGPRQVVQIGEKAVDFNPAFRLYMTTRDQFVQIPPNNEALVTPVNFTVTKSGLEGQLLSLTINFEQPELESRKTQILEQEDKLKIQLADFEKKLLMALAQSTGNILENKQLIDNLNQTKAQSSQIEAALQESKQLQVSLDQQREVYRNFSMIGANLFMVFGDLIKMNNMYQFSLQSFIKLFNRALETKPQAASTEEKLQILSNNLVRLSFSEIARSMFKADRLTYSLHFVRGVFPQLFQKNEFEFFTGVTTAGTEARVRVPKWISPDRNEIFGMFSSTFPIFAQNLSLENEQLWSEFSNSDTAEKNIPQQINSKISAFQRCLLIQVFRPDRLETAMQNFVKEAFGGQNIQPTPFSLSNLYQSESTCNDPILFIISPGSDPSAELQAFAEQTIGRNCYHELAMGGGQNEIAIETMKDAAAKGEWVCFKNLHLVTPWLTVLEKEFKMLTPHKSFRLWLTSEPHVKFPSILLQSSLKITYETPPGVRNNLQRTLQYVMPKQADYQETSKMQLLFILSWFHALIQERRTYIPQGWVKYYEFSYGDLKAGETLLADILKESQGKSPQWQKIYGILENAIYGGRVDNDFDLRVLRTYMEQIFKDSVLKGQEMLSNTIQAPQSKNSADFFGAINKLADTDNPELFGLPSNIDRSVQRFNSTQVINCLKNLQLVSAQELRFDKQKWQELLGPFCALWTNVYKKEEFNQVRIGKKDLQTQDPVDQFVYMEVQAVIQILKKVNESITSIVGVLNGTEMLTPMIESEATSLLKNAVPQSWEKMWEGSENPSNWIRTINRKGQALLNWIGRVQKGNLLTTQVNLSDLLHPETFLNALRQRSARIFKVAINELKLVSSFDLSKLDKQGAIALEGLWLQGCSFEKTQLVDIKGQTNEIIMLPVCAISWISQSSQDPSAGSTVEVPVYYSLDREKLLCTLKVSNQGDSAKRIISGVALFLNGSD